MSQLNGRTYRSGPYAVGGRAFLFPYTDRKLGFLLSKPSVLLGGPLSAPGQPKPPTRPWTVYQATTVGGVNQTASTYGENRTRWVNVTPIVR